MYELSMDAEIATKPLLTQKSFGEIALVGPLLIVLIVRVICVAPTKNGNI